MKKNNNNNNNNKRNNNRNAKRRIKYKPIPSTRIYTYDINAYYDITEGQNNQYDVVSNMLNNSQYSDLARLYGEFKIVYVSLRYTPIPNQGTYPAPMYILPVMNEELSIGYNNIPRVQGALFVNGRDMKEFKFYRTGRNDDFNRWYNTNSTATERANIKVYQRATSTLSSTGTKYQVHVRIRVLFRGKNSSIVSRLQPEQDTKEEEIINSDCILVDAQETHPVEVQTGFESISGPLDKVD
jgi:hypothetical protein